MPNYKHSLLSFGMADLSNEKIYEKTYIDQVIAKINEHKTETAIKMINKLNPNQITSSHIQKLFVTTTKANQPKVSMAIIDFVQALNNKKKQNDFALVPNQYNGYTHFTMASFYRQGGTAKFLEFVKILDEEKQNEFTLSHDLSGCLDIERAVEKYHPKAAIALIDFAKTLKDEETKNKFILARDNHYRNKQFKSAIEYRQPEVAMALINFAKTLKDEETKNKFVLETTTSPPALGYTPSFFEAALEVDYLEEDYEEVAMALIDFAKTLKNKETQEKFILFTRENGSTVNTVLKSGRSKVAIEFLKLAADIVPKEVIKWDIPKNIQTDDSFKSIAQKIANCEDLTQEEIIDFLKKKKN